MHVVFIKKYLSGYLALLDAQAFVDYSGPLRQATIFMLLCVGCLLFLGMSSDFEMMAEVISFNGPPPQ